MPRFFLCLAALTLIALPTSAQTAVSAPPRLVPQAGFEVPVTDVAISADGRVAVTSGWDGALRVWDARTGAEIHRFEGLGGPFPTLGPDGLRMALVGAEGAAVWDVLTGTHGPWFAEGASQAALCGGGPLVATAHDGIEVWDAEAAVLRWRAEAPASRLACSRDGQVVAAIGNVPDPTSAVLQFWDALTGRLLRRIELEPGPYPDALSLSADGRWALVHLGEESEAVLWDAATGAVAARFDAAPAEIVAASLSPDGATVLTVEAEGRADGGPRRERVALWDARTGTRLRDLGGSDRITQGAPVSGVLFGASAALGADRAVTAGLDATPVIWNLGTGEALRVGRALPVASVSWAGGRLATAGRNAPQRRAEARVWDLTIGRVETQLPLAGAEGVAVGLSADGRTAVTADGPPRLGDPAQEGAVRVWDVATSRERHRLSDPARRPRHAAVSADGRFAAAVLLDLDHEQARWTESAAAWDTETGRLLHRLSLDMTRDVRLSADGTVALLTDFVDYYLKDSEERTGGARVWDLRTGELGPPLGADSLGTDRAVLSADGQVVVTVGRAVRVWDAKTGALVRQVGRIDGEVLAAELSADGSLLVTHEDDGTLRAWDLRTNAERVLRDDLFYDLYDDLDEPPVFAVSPDGRVVAIADERGETTLVDAGTGRTLASLLSFADGSWLVVTPDGRFDAPDLETVTGAVWVAPDDPLTPLPIEAFMADFYEPRLLPRLLAGETFPDMGRLLDRNRVQPRVEITSVEAPASGEVPSGGASGARGARVTVEVEGLERAYGGEAHASGVHDLRLFRDGQLVAWADGELIKSTGARSFTFEDVPLPSGADTLTFSAYAFNGDRVKSRTAYRDLAVPSGAAPQGQRRAFVVALGVDAFADPAWDLAFATADARAYARALDSTLAASGDYDEVVAVALVSSHGEAESTDATAAALRGALARLAGDEPDAEAEAALARVPGAERLREATPDDVVVVTASTHGYTSPEGVFYLLPADVPVPEPGASGGSAITPALLEAAVSSDELGAWFRGVDAGTLALVVDACNAAGAVEGSGFKPGPMGARGLGQLAFDKGMAVLTATQAAAPALEAASTGRGLLTFALVENGLLAGQADGAVPDGASGASGVRDGRITLGEWLAYGAARVPGLSEEVQRGEVETYGRGGVRTRSMSPDAEGTSPDAGLQTPALFDFRRSRAPVVVAGTGG